MKKLFRKCCSVLTWVLVVAGTIVVIPFAIVTYFMVFLLNELNDLTKLW